MAAENDITEQLIEARVEIERLKGKSATTLSGTEFLTLLFMMPIIISFVLSNSVSGVFDISVRAFSTLLTVDDEYPWRRTISKVPSVNASQLDHRSISARYSRNHPNFSSIQSIDATGRIIHEA